MAIDATSATSSALAAATSSESNPKGVLGKDDFMKLLLVQLQYQDPTEPMDTEKILTQTSQLASLESADNTKTALEKLAASLGNAQQFSTISAIGKTADLGSDAIAHDKGTQSTFEVYFPNAVEQGTVSITDADGKTVQTLNVGTNPAGVYQFTWDGTDSLGNQADSAVYHVNAQYSDANGVAQQTRLGAYPIESVRFDQGNTLVKVGSNYVPLDNIKEVY
ncbi:FlgD immunoglobulin-like domain containing protein [Sulfurimonas autotrophica]|uniref:Basal-body rod modification protein FlgD n=1 Tax=Sulfurimonas autotrophica (strain ATCC BAA-671 / DSM 16294 / JCM 11897 / OK10) TaxID=563040 RepID=E0USR3_SULAO|nr:FlgD immunoglobulin-like domain containing protein [Sulfurimonas autotrophica]ADN08090.1 flagellar hook capping protein [Sulfurimonas autotrophica DSM 16294]